MKVKYIAGIYGYDDFDDKINNFIKDKKVIDIKFTDSLGIHDRSYFEGAESALIMYEENKK